LSEEFLVSSATLKLVCGKKATRKESITAALGLMAIIFGDGKNNMTSIQEMPYRRRISEHVEDIERVERIAALLEGEMLDSTARELARLFIKSVMESSKNDTKDFLQNVKEEDGI
jgi:hypothetical protein